MTSSVIELNNTLDLTDSFRNREADFIMLHNVLFFTYFYLNWFIWYPVLFWVLFVLTVSHPNVVLKAAITPKKEGRLWACTRLMIYCRVDLCCLESGHIFQMKRFQRLCSELLPLQWNHLSTRTKSLSLRAHRWGFRHPASHFTFDWLNWC